MYLELNSAIMKRFIHNDIPFIHNDIVAQFTYIRK